MKAGSDKRQMLCREGGNDMKKLMKGLFAAFWLAVLLVPLSTFGADGTVTECSYCKSTNIYVTRTNWYNGKHQCVYKCKEASCKKETYGTYVPCDVTMPTNCNLPGL